MQKKKLFCIMFSLLIFCICIIMVPLFVVAMDSPEGEETANTESNADISAVNEAPDSTDEADAEETVKGTIEETVEETGTTGAKEVINETEGAAEGTVAETEKNNEIETVDEVNETETVDELKQINEPDLKTPIAEEMGFPTKDKSEQKMRVGLMSVNTENNGYTQVSNDYVEYAVNSIGRFTLGTTGGDPDNSEDNNKKMLYGHPVSTYGGTSYTTVRIDDANYMYTIDDYSKNSIDETNNKHTSTMMINGILQVTQELSIVQNATTQRADTVQIRYTVGNMDTESHSLGLRIMLDTMLGDNDDAPFRIPGYGELTKQKEFAEKSTPQYWQAFDSLSNPSVIANGTLIKSTAGAPSRVQFTNWWTVSEMPWGHVPNEDEDNSDSAVCVIWDEEIIEPGQTKTFVTYYGLSCFETMQTEKMLVSLSAPKALAADDSEQFYEPDPFRISLYVKNTSGEAITNAKARIMLPAELRLFGISNTNEISIENLSSLEEKQISWLLYADAQVESTEVTLKIIVTADDLEDIVLVHKLSLPRLINGVASYSVKMGNQFEQTVYPDRTVTPPRINNVHIENIAPGKYRLSLEENDYSVSSKAYPFFCWEALEGSFEKVDDSFKTVIYNVPTDTQGRRLLLKAHLGDGLGHAVQYKFWIDGIN